MYCFNHVSNNKQSQKPHTSVPILLALDAGPAAGEGVGVMDEPAGEGAKASGVWLKSSRQIGDDELYSSCSSKPKNLMRKQKKSIYIHTYLFGERASE